MLARAVRPARYGGGQWQVAGAVAEIASGRSWADLIRVTYVEPCGLETLSFNNYAQLRQSSSNPFDYPLGFDSNPAVLKPTLNPNMEGGAYASIGDYAELLFMHLRGGLFDDRRVLARRRRDCRGSTARARPRRRAPRPRSHRASARAARHRRS